MYFLHRVEIDPYRRRAAQPRSPARENFRRRVNHAFCSGIPLQRDTHTLRRLSHPACASAGIPVLFRLPHPARASAGIPILFCRQPPPRPRLRQRIPRHFFGLLHPARAFGKGYPDTSSASSTPPAPGGGVRARAYIRGAAVPGSSPGSPRALDRGGHRYWERRPAGRRRSPPPCLSRPQDPAHRADPACLSAGGNPDFFPPSPPGACPYKTPPGICNG